MKTAYELAMERLAKSAPARKLSARQKEAIAELESSYKAKTAQVEIGLKAEMERALESGDLEAAEQARERLASERRKLQSELEEKKEAVRQGKA